MKSANQRIIDRCTPKPVKVYDSRRFEYDPALSQLHSEASSLGEPPSHRWNHGDTIDIKSSKTGAVVRFILYSIERVSSGEILGWTFKPVKPAESTGVTNVWICND